jgi:hypothetical protein
MRDSPTVADALLEEAIRLHRDGRLDEAERSMKRGHH